MRVDISIWIRQVASVAMAVAVLTALYPASPRAELSAIGAQRVGLALFPKWVATLERFAAQQVRCDERPCDPAKWARLLAGLDGLDRGEMIRTVNRRVNALPYVSDRKAWHQPDYWATPFEFLVAGGDCEDFAVTKYLALRSVGVAADAMRIAIVWDRARSLHHAVLLVHQGGEMLVLDNLAPRVRGWAEARTYVPIYSINETSWWLHQPMRIDGRPTLPSVGLDNDATRTDDGVEELGMNVVGNREGRAIN